MPKWAIYYADGQVVRDDDSDELVTLTFPKAWLEAPPDGVQAVCIEQAASGRAVLSMADCYYIFPVEHHGAGEPGCADSLGAFLRSIGIVKYGGWTAEANYLRIRKQVMNDNYPPLHGTEKEHRGSDESD